MPNASYSLQEGDPAPDFKLSDAAGNQVSLSQFQGKKQVVLYFYPRDLTPGCTTESCDFSTNLHAFEKVNAVVLGISLDNPKTHQKFIQKHDLKHTLLSDTEKKVVQAYGVYQEKNLYGKKVLGIVRSTFVIDLQGMIKKIFPKVKVDGHWREVLDALKR